MSDLSPFRKIETDMQPFIIIKCVFLLSWYSFSNAQTKNCTQTSTSAHQKLAYSKKKTNKQTTPLLSLQLWLLLLQYGSKRCTTLKLQNAAAGDIAIVSHIFSCSTVCYLFFYILFGSHFCCLSFFFCLSCVLYVVYRLVSSRMALTKACFKKLKKKQK